MQGNIGHYSTDFFSPSYLAPVTVNTASSIANYGVTATHALPLSGNLGLGWSRITSEFGDNNHTSNSSTVSAGISPWQRLSISQYFNYTTNADISFAQTLGDRTIPLGFVPSSDSSTIYLNTTATLAVGRWMTVTGYLNHRILHFQGRDLENTQYGGTINFQKVNNLFGFLRFSIGVRDTANQEGNGHLGLVTNLSMFRKFGKWETNADFNYAQDTQTLYSVVTTSNFNYGGMIRRKIGSDMHWNTSYRESRSGLTAQEGSNNDSHSFSSSFSLKQFSLTGSYSQSNGEALLLADGTLTATPLSSSLSDYYLTFNARSYGAYASVLLFRRLTLSGSYSNVSSNTVRKALDTFNNGDRVYARLSYRMRRLYIQGGFSRGVQESSAISGGPRTVNSYYVSLSRWFDVF
jgi:hypothetical protein